MIASGKPVINMGIGSPDLKPAPEVLHSLEQAMKHPGAHQYQSYQGIPELREAMAGFYKRKFNVDLDPAEEILPLMGSKEGIMHISLAFLNPGDEVLLPNPGYPTYSSVTRLLGAVPRPYRLKEENGWLPDLEALERSDLSKVKLMWITYPHMPTGAKAGREALSAMVDFARKHKILLVNDNPYSFVLGKQPESLLGIPGFRDVALELNSLSKTFNLAGWRVGMAMGSGALLRAILKVKSNMDSGMFYGIQKGAVAALEAPPSWFQQQDERYAKRREKVARLADYLGCSYDPDSVGMFVWAKLPDNTTRSEEFVDQLLHEHHIFIAPGTVFGDAGEGYVRFSLCVEEEQIDLAIDRIKKTYA